MIVNSRQTWDVGSEVRVGFMRLFVIAAIASPGNHRPDGYVLATARHAPAFIYSFVPHHGLRRHATQADAIAEITA